MDIKATAITFLLPIYHQNIMVGLQSNLFASFLLVVVNSQQTISLTGILACICGHGIIRDV